MHIIPNLVPKSLITGITIVTLVLGGLFYYAQIHQPRLIPANVFINSLPVGGMTPVQAKESLALTVRNYRSQWPILFTYHSSTFSVSIQDMAVRYDLDQAVDKALNIDSGFFNVPILTSRKPRVVELPVEIDQEWLSSQSAIIAQSLDVSVVNPRVEVVQTASGAAVKIVEGKDGQKFDQTAWKQHLTSSLQQLSIPNTVLETKPLLQTASLEQKQQAYHLAQSLLKLSLNLKLAIETEPEKTWQLSGQDLVRFVEIQTKYDYPVIQSYVDGLAQNINRPPKDAKFQFDESIGKVKDFTPAEKGIAVEVNKTADAIAATLNQMILDSKQNTAVIVVQTTDPDVQLSEVNRLGLKERIGDGKSTFLHSIPSRVHNVILGASRINGTLIKPGEEFSFNQAVGDISAATGYQQAYIIQNGRTVLGDGGGMCQVSTTVFRAALNAGFPITVRRGHAYRVGYYEQDTKAGIDATVFSPSTDLKFLNDTASHILIQTYVNEPKRELMVFIYGTSDGRVTTIKDHEVWGITPPLPDVWVDDPTLANGTVKQVDWKAAGAKAKFTQLVERDGQVLFEKTFYTTYQPWASVFLRGIKL